ncbi:trigger factor [Desulfuribacillus alkaliarsenatis]|uniref:peptidylprolyl isomerase n=1 Tax=Desulfuribacillus alkaliarsenatis TaxID=766136 RepID=A0A1E5G0W2_9FIRM|nr:trigger factor [Desulfuribacillus alkaliarsenatis]OEF96547.1 trigger factor [Desulfuribacillus alkaliarsenatis]
MDTNTQNTTNNTTQPVEVRTEIGSITVGLGAYKGLKKPEQKAITVTEQEIEQELEAYRDRHAKLEPVADGIVQTGDIVKIDYQGYIDGSPFDGGSGKNQALEIGSGGFILSFEEQMVGMKTNEDKQIEVDFPENYHVRKLAGSTVTFHIKVNEITRKTLPELNDDLAKAVSYCKTLDELKEDIKKNIVSYKEMEVGKYIKDVLVSIPVKNSLVEIPESLIDIEIKKMIADLEHHVKSKGITVDKYLETAGISREEFEAQFRTEAEKRVQTQLVLMAIAKTERMHVTEDEITNQINQIATMHKTKASDIRTHLIDGGNYTAFKNEIAMRKAVELIVQFSE